MLYIHQFKKTEIGKVDLKTEPNYILSIETHFRHNVIGRMNFYKRKGKIYCAHIS